MPHVAGPDQCHCVQESDKMREGRGCKGSASARVLLFTPFLPHCQLGRGLQEHSLSCREADRWQDISWKMQSPFGAQYNVSPPSGPAFLGYCLRAKTDTTICRRNVRGLFAELPRHRQRPKGKQSCSDLFPHSRPQSFLSPSTWGDRCYLGRVHINKTHMRRRWGLPMLLVSPLLKLHYLLQCKKYQYPKGGEECLIHNASASCILFLFSCL